MEKKKKLTAKQRTFVDEYLVDLNATQAAIRAGYSQRTAKEIGCQNLTKLNIAAAIDKAIMARSARTKITVDRVLKELARLAFANMFDYVRVNSDGLAYVDLSDITRDQFAAVQELNIDQYLEFENDEAREVKKVKLKLADKRSNLELIGRHLKMFTDKIEHGGELTLGQIVKDIQGRKHGILPPGED